MSYRCGLTRYVTRLRNGCTPATWFMDGRAAPGGWQGGRVDETPVEGTTRRVDICPACVAKQEQQTP